MPFFNYLNNSSWFLSNKYELAWLQFYFTSIFAKIRKKTLSSNGPEEGSFFENFPSLSESSCQVEGHGGTLFKFSLKFTKNFSRRIWKIFSGFTHLRPLYRNMLLIWLDTQWERLWHFWSTVFLNLNPHFAVPSNDHSSKKAQIYCSMTEIL